MREKYSFISACVCVSSGTTFVCGAEAQIHLHAGCSLKWR